jgi:hypothetical protein
MLRVGRVWRGKWKTRTHHLPGYPFPTTGRGPHPLPDLTSSPPQSMHVAHFFPPVFQPPPHRPTAGTVHLAGLDPTPGSEMQGAGAPLSLGTS